MQAGARSNRVLSGPYVPVVGCGRVQEDMRRSQLMRAHEMRCEVVIVSHVSGKPNISAPWSVARTKDTSLLKRSMRSLAVLVPLPLVKASIALDVRGARIVSIAII